MPMCLKLPWIGNIYLKFEKQVKSNVQNCFRAVDPRVIFHTKKILPSIYKDAEPITHQSMVVYQYVCRCDCPDQQDCDSVVGLHLIQNPDCASHYHIDQFSILAIAKTIFHLGTLEATFTKT